jgi:hypothetical protein
MGARKPQKNCIKMSIKYVFALPAVRSFSFIIVPVPCRVRLQDMLKPSLVKNQFISIMNRPVLVD